MRLVKGLVKGHRSGVQGGIRYGLFNVVAGRLATASPARRACCCKLSCELAVHRKLCGGLLTAVAIKRGHLWVAASGHSDY